MSDLLSGKRAIVTGGSKGIGLEIARALLREGASVVICGRDQRTLDTALADLQTVSPGKVFATPASVSDPQQVAALFQFAARELGGLDILINNAGSATFRTTAELSIEEWDRIISTNLSGAFYCSREALALFHNVRGGFIINISSLAGKNAFAGGAAYNASKFGLNGFSEAMMLDHRYDNVRVSYIMPGSVETGFGGHDPSARSNWKIAAEDVAQIVLDILHMPARTLISRVEVRPSRPAKN